MSKTLPVTENFDATKQIGIIILDDAVKLKTDSVISFELEVLPDRTFVVKSFSLISGEGYCKFRGDIKEELDKVKDAEVLLQTPNDEKEETKPTDNNGGVSENSSTQ
jgi:hypothetical protein